MKQIARVCQLTALVDSGLIYKMASGIQRIQLWSFTQTIVTRIASMKMDGQSLASSKEEKDLGILIIYKLMANL